MEALGLTPGFWKGRRVFLTGHTGFKGGWLAMWLDHLGAEVSGFALAPPTTPSLFEVAGVAACLKHHTIGDIREAGSLQAAVNAADPEIVFHLAAQPLVRESYSTPVDTYATNVMGTVNVLEAVRRQPGVRAFVNITTDKCYENREWTWGYREIDPLGGRDPYSSSKACSELVTAAYRASFFQQGAKLATARAGNVIGGGDWATDRLLPDFFRALLRDEPLEVRSPGAVRPWQHVLEPLCGYLLIAERLTSGDGHWDEAWNFGPTDEDCLSVAQILDFVRAQTGGKPWRASPGPRPHEATNLRLDSSKARAQLGWQPRWPIQAALRHTAEWHAHWVRQSDMYRICVEQIDSYQQS